MSARMDDWTTGTEAIIYQSCAACGAKQYFRRRFCAACGTTDPIENRASGQGTVYGGPGPQSPIDMTMPVTMNSIDNSGSLTGHILSQGWAEPPDINRRSNTNHQRHSDRRSDAAGAARHQRDTSTKIQSHRSNLTRE